MKTEKRSFTFCKEQVQQYIQMLSDPNPIYDSESIAQQLELRTIPIPPVMPMTLYQSFTIPWTLQAPVILRKQRCIHHKKMYIDEVYTGFISLSDVKVRKRHTFSTETLFLYNKEGELCFSGISQLVSGELTC